MQNVTVVGLGIIGKAWAKNLHDDGLNVRAWNRTPQPDLPYFEPDLEKAVADAEAIIIVVADPPAVENILKVIVPVLKTGQLVIQSSTISAHWTLEFAKKVEGAGGRFLEAPFTGSKLAAEARKTVFYLGGPPAIIEVARPLLQRISSTLLHVGELGSASSLKLAMNLNIAVMCAGLSEALALVRSQGISDNTFFDALHINVGRSGFSDLKEPKFRARDYSPQFSLKHLDKDLRLALETSGDLSLPVTEALKYFYESGLEAGYGDDDFTGMMRLIEPTV